MNSIRLVNLPALAAGLLGLAIASTASAQIAGATPPANPPAYFLPSWQSALGSPLPPAIARATGSIGASVQTNEADLDAYGWLGTNQPGGTTITSTNAFFEPLGTNGRACSTCHQPAAAMSINLTQIKLRYLLTGGMDPLFAPVDGANCPNMVPAASTAPSYWGKRLGKGSSMAAAHSLILTRGVFRIFLPVPKGAEFTISVVTDPTTCNLDSNYNQVTDTTQTPAVVTQMISVFRRPRIATNLKFATTTLADAGILPAFDLISGVPFATDPFTLIPESGNIMWDGREPTLESQATDATMGHAQAIVPPTATQVAQMVAFETGIYSAQSRDSIAGSLTLLGGLGGPVDLEPNIPAQGASLAPGEHVNIYDAWSTITGTTAASLKQQSIYRGQVIFNTRPFVINNVSGLNNIPGVFTNPTTGTCSVCHNQINSGNDAAPGAQHDIGVSGTESASDGPAPSTDLPIFTVTCNVGIPPTEIPGYNGTTVTTNDPGLALITGKCADIGRTTVPQLRGVVAHAPYFHDGSATSLLSVVNFYNTRFSIGMSTQDKTDLVNFLSAL